MLLSSSEREKVSFKQNVLNRKSQDGTAILTSYFEKIISDVKTMEKTAVESILINHGLDVADMLRHTFYVGFGNRRKLKTPH